MVPARGRVSARRCRRAAAIEITLRPARADVVELIQQLAAAIGMRAQLRPLNADELDEGSSD